MNTTASSSLALRLLPALAFATLGAGCVGYNSTLFVTKSNVGLDFDTKPPTTEITISRKEGVISPSFEGGKTPPVLASFKPHGGNGNGFENFFFGVDQTFAGGDAAIAMTKLYDSPVPGAYTAAPGEASTDYDSSLTVTEPVARFCWQKIPDASAARPFVFATDTMVGLKIGWTGAASVPDSVKIGFNRKEFAWAPLSKSPKDARGKVALKNPSFLATVEHEIKIAGTENETSAMQYFATGEAATLLARQPAVRKAMLTRLDPKLGFQLGGSVPVEYLSTTFQIINGLSSSGDTTAQELLGKLQALEGITLPSAPVYTFAYNPANFTITQSGPNPPANPRDLPSLITLVGDLESNQRQLNQVWQAISEGRGVLYQAPGAAATIPVTDTERKMLLDAQTANARQLDELRDQISTNRAVTNATYFVLSLLSPR